MKKMSAFCMMVLLACVSFFVVNLSYTKEIIRIQEMDKTIHSADFYLKDVKQPPEEIITFFEKIVQKYKVSIVKTDNHDEVIKAGVFYEETFPYQQFGLSSLDFSADGRGIYTNARSSDKIGYIPTFLHAKTISLLTLKEYFKDSSHTVNGQYRITTTYATDQLPILKEIGAYFDLDVSVLTEPTFKSAVGLVNRDLLLTVVLFVIALILLILTTVYQPMIEMKKVGVEKLLGYSNYSILSRFIKYNLFVLFVGSVIVNIIPLFVVEYLPQNFYTMMLLAHAMIIQLYVLLNLVVYWLIQKISVSSMIKGFTSFKMGLYFNYVLKTLMTVLMIVLLIGVGNGVVEANKELSFQEQWETQGNYLTLETVKSSVQLWQDMLVGSDVAHEYYYQFYKELNQLLPINYVRSSVVDPKVFSISEKQVPSEIPVLYANSHYLISQGFKVPTLKDKKQVLLPRTMEEEADKALFIAKLIGFQSLKYEEQEKTSVADVEVDVSYYEGEWSFFPYSDNISSNLKNPIISLVNDDNMLWEEKAYLSSTGLSNPMKIENTASNQKIIEDCVSHLPDGSYFKFSSIKSIQQGRIDTYRDAVRNFNVLFMILGILSFVVSYFIVVSIFIWKKSYISTMKFLGWTLFDRYKSLLVMMMVLYLVPVPIIVLFGKSIVPLLFFGIFTILDMIILLMFAYRMEQKKLSQHLKGENL